MLISDWSPAYRSSSSKRGRNNNQLISQTGTHRATNTTAEGRIMAASLGVSLHFIIELKQNTDGLFFFFTYWGCLCSFGALLFSKNIVVVLVCFLLKVQTQNLEEKCQVNKQRNK